MPQIIFKIGNRSFPLSPEQVQFYLEVSFISFEFSITMFNNKVETLSIVVLISSVCTKS